MSGAVLNFTPRSELDAAANVQAFVELCRNSHILDAARQFDQNVWDVGRQKGQNKVLRAVFSTLEAAAQDKAEPLFPEPFMSFAKATLVYLHDERPVVSQSPRVAALRCLEAALRECGKGSRPTATDEAVLDTAAELAKRQSPAVAYRTAGQLEYIAEFMRSNSFIYLRQHWIHGIEKPAELGSRISKQAMEARQKKLPSEATLRALGGIFHQAVNAPDVVVSSIAALMLCAPDRINEVVRLRRNCIVDGEGEFRGKLGLRWSGSKGFEDTTKWIPTEMSPVARAAVKNLTDVSAHARALAAWYTANPNHLYIHDGAHHLRGKETLTPREIGLLLWGDETACNQANVWAQTTVKLTKHMLGARAIGFKFEDVERAVIAMLPDTFPHMPGDPELLCEDALAIIRANEMHADRATYLCMFSCVDQAVVTNAFGRDDRDSIFVRFDYTEDDGSPIELRSHSLRHYLNMLAQVGGLSSAEIAIFSGRKDVKLNRAYDHMDSREVQAPISKALKAGFTSEIVPTAPRDRKLVTRSEFKGLGLAAAHTTEFGWCSLDFASSPCQMYRDCLNCTAQECVKGDVDKEANLRLHKAETEYLLKKAKEALSDEEYGADAWVAHQSSTLGRISAFLKVFEDPAVVDGARIRLDATNAPLITLNNVHPIELVGQIAQRALA